MKTLFMAVALLGSLSVFAGELDCGKIKSATFESRTGLKMESERVYLIHGVSAAAAIALAVSQDLEICVYGISGNQATGITIKR